MGRVAWIFFAMLSVSAQAAWVEDAKSERFTVYLDKANAIRSSDSFKIQTLYDYKVLQTDGESPAYMSIRLQTEVDCKGSRMRLSGISFFSGPMAQGRVVRSEPEASEWESVPAQHKGESLWRLACVR